MKETTLHAKHVALGAKMVEFGGWDMPVQYGGIQDETMAVRQNVGVFDVSHMGEIRVKGSGAGAYLDWILSRPVAGRKPEMISYAILCLPSGGAVDDLLVYTFDTEDYWLVVNASNTDKDFAYLNDMRSAYQESHPEASMDFTIVNESPDYAQLAVQGPNSLAMVEKLLTAHGESAEFVGQLAGMKPYRQINRLIPNEKARLVVSRTGYTGEDGFEIYCPQSMVIAYWDSLIEYNVVPCGLGSRDALRLEAGMPLYGHEMSEEISPLEAGQSFAIRFDRDFVADKAMRANATRKIIAIQSEGKAIPREHYDVFAGGQLIGHVTSGSFSPTLQRGVAMVMVAADFPDDVNEFTVAIHRKEQPFSRTTLPFVKKK